MQIGGSARGLSAAVDHRLHQHRVWLCGRVSTTGIRGTCGQPVLSCGQVKG
jgi:hypothetical protein